MFDPHRLNRRYSRKTQRNGQIIRSRLIDPPQTIDLHKVQMYRDFILNNPDCGLPGPPLPQPPTPPPPPPWPQPQPPDPTPPDPDIPPLPPPLPPVPGPEPDPEPNPPLPPPPLPPPPPIPPEPEPEPDPEPQPQLPYTLSNISIYRANDFNVFSQFSANEVLNWPYHTCLHDSSTGLYYITFPLEPPNGLKYVIFYLESSSRTGFAFFNLNINSNVTVSNNKIKLVFMWPFFEEFTHEPVVRYQTLQIPELHSHQPILVLAVNDTLDPGSTAPMDFAVLTPSYIPYLPDGGNDAQGFVLPVSSFSKRTFSLYSI